VNTTVLDERYFKSLVDFEAANERVRSRLSRLQSGADLVRFMARYGSWNGRFASGVASLAGTIGNCRDLFREQGYPKAVADRSNYIASFVFDAAIDEFDDHISPIRDTHRCMAQAELICMNDYYGLDSVILDEDEPASLRLLNEAVGRGYAGHAGALLGALGCVFAGMGYHLGSELLADREFSLLDEHLRSTQNDLVQFLMRETVQVAGGKHRCYAWIGVHSGHGGGVEADHFDHAVQGVRAALKFLVGDERSHAAALRALTDGFQAFERDHREFFEVVAAG
jgi:hypothetical protein